jgi:hypothetical protein
LDNIVSISKSVIGFTFLRIVFDTPFTDKVIVVSVSLPQTEKLSSANFSQVFPSSYDTHQA